MESRPETKRRLEARCLKLVGYLRATAPEIWVPLVIKLIEAVVELAPKILEALDRSPDIRPVSDLTVELLLSDRWWMVERDVGDYGTRWQLYHGAELQPDYGFTGAIRCYQVAGPEAPWKFEKWGSE